MKKRKELTEKERIKEEKRKVRAKVKLNKAYTIALLNKTLPEFRIENGVILIKRISKTKLEKYKKEWKKNISQQIKEFTFDNVCECWNEPFEANIRKYNAHDRILQYFYWEHEIDLLSPLMPYKIVDSF